MGAVGDRVRLYGRPGRGRAAQQPLQETVAARSPCVFFDAFFILIHLLKRDYELAVAVGRAVSEMNPSFSSTYKPYLAALGHLGRTQEATIVRWRLMAIEPNFTVERFIATSPFERESDRDLFAKGLRLGGVPETGADAVEQQPQSPSSVA